MDKGGKRGCKRGPRLDAKELYNKFARSGADATDPQMSYENYADGYRSVDNKVSAVKIREAFEFGDRNGNKYLDRKEFGHLVAMFNGPPCGVEGEEKLSWYWKHFVYDHAKGMTKDEFMAGAMTESPDAKPKQVENWWNMVNKDGNDTISKKEFF